jgi:hypothetical protein
LKAPQEIGESRARPDRFSWSTPAGERVEGILRAWAKDQVNGEAAFVVWESLEAYRAGPKLRALLLDRFGGPVPTRLTKLSPALGQAIAEVGPPAGTKEHRRLVKKFLDRAIFDFAAFLSERLDRQIS